jgi:hypothetical protein
MDIFRKLLDKVGKGGVRCICCNRFVGKVKHKPKHTRRTRSRLKQQDQKEFKKYT